jgi:hypothetical protein
MTMANLPTSPVIIQEDPNVAGPGSGMEGGASDSAIGICTDVPNPKESDWDRTVKGATNNPIGLPDNPPTPYQSLVEYSIDTFDSMPIGFAEADTQAAPGEVYATNAGASGWDLTNKTAGYTTEVGDWLWGAVSGSAEPTCKVYICDSYRDALVSIVDKVWLLHDPATNVDQLAEDGEQLFRSGTSATTTPILLDQCPELNPQSLYVTSNSTSSFRRDALSVPPLDFGSGLSGGFGAFFRNDDNRAGTQIGVGYDSGYGTGQVSIRVFGGSQQISVYWNNTFYLVKTVNFSGPRKYVWLNYSLAADGSSATFEWFVDWVSVGGPATIVAAGPVPSANPQWFGLGALGGFGKYYMEYAAYSSNEVTLSEAEILSSALSQNALDYVDPNPNCIPP